MLITEFWVPLDDLCQGRTFVFGRIPRARRIPPAESECLNDWLVPIRCTELWQVGLRRGLGKG